MPSKRQAKRAKRQRVSSPAPERVERPARVPVRTVTGPRTKTQGPNTARRAAKTRSTSDRRVPLIATLIGAIALIALGTFLFQRFGGDDDSENPSNQSASGTEIAAQTGSPAVMSASASGCWDAEPTTTSGDPPQWTEAPHQVIDPAKTYTATIETTAGTIMVDLAQDRAPVTVNNFVCLSRAGYYDNTPFHRIMLDFMIQGGDPTGTGTSGPGYQFADELPQGETPYVRGTLAMANSGPDTNGSQFFIVHQDRPAGFPSNYAIFGQVTQGLEIVDALAAMPVTDNGRGEMSAPTDDVRIVSVTIAEQ